jgi:hypothetical protein
VAAVHGRLRQTQTAIRRRVFCLCVLVELYANAGYPDEGRRVLGDISDTYRQAFLGPEVYRVEGELLLRGHAPATGNAGRLFLTAMELTGQRGEKSLELRAATSLARLYQILASGA